MKRGTVLGAVMLVGLLSIVAIAMQAPGGQRGGPSTADPVGIEKVKDNLYMITGGGGNTAAFITERGVVVVDTKNPGWGQAILDKIKRVTDKPVTTIINTHTHLDHVGSNEAFPDTVDFVAHEVTKANMEKLDAFKGDKARFLPKRTFKDRMTIGTGKDQVELYFFGRASTGGDAWVLFKDARVLVAGDLLNSTVPRIDAMNGGSAVEYGNTLQRVYDATNKMVDTIIAGHIPLARLADLKEYADFNHDLIAWVQEEMKAGKTVDQAAAEWKLPAKYQKPSSLIALDRYGPPEPGIKAYIQAAYNELRR